MSSYITVKRVCERCNQEFITRTTVTRFCFDICAKRNYKKQQKAYKIDAANPETNHELKEQYGMNENTFKEKEAKTSLREFLKINELAKVLGVSKRTLFRSIKISDFPKVKIGKILLFNKQDVL